MSAQIEFHQFHQNLLLSIFHQIVRQARHNRARIPVFRIAHQFPDE